MPKKKEDGTMESNDTPEVVVTEVAAEAEAPLSINEQTRLEMEAGRAALAAKAASAKIETGE
jgi:hypothetical protein